MNKAGMVLGVIAAVAIGSVLYVQHLDSVELRREIALLRTEVQQGATSGSGVAAAAVIAASRSDTTATSGAIDAAELRKLREDIGALRKSTQEISQFTQLAQAAAAMKSLGNTEGSIPTKLTSTEALRNLGRATPESATETVLWAAAGGDVDILSNSFLFTPTAREKADAWFAGLSESTRKQYGSPEKVIALMIARDAASLSGMQVLGQKEIAPDNVGVRVRFGSVDGKTKDDNLLMRRSTDGWRMVIPDNAVEKFARQLAGVK